MFAITIDEKNYIIGISDTFRTPGSILVNEIPETEDPEKMACYKYIDNKYVFDFDKWAAIESERKEQEAAAVEKARIDGIKQGIDELKGEIAASDYQIIKCYEYALNGLDLPYDAAKLHEERQALRDKINELEELLNAEG